MSQGWSLIFNMIKHNSVGDPTVSWREPLSTMQGGGHSGKPEDGRGGDPVLKERRKRLIVLQGPYSFSIIQVRGEVTSRPSLFQTSPYLSRRGSGDKKSEVRKWLVSLLPRVSEKPVSPRGAAVRPPPAAAGLRCGPLRCGEEMSHIIGPVTCTQVSPLRVHFRETGEKQFNGSSGMRFRSASPLPDSSNIEARGAETSPSDLKHLLGIALRI